MVTLKLGFKQSLSVKTLIIRKSVIASNVHIDSDSIFTDFGSYLKVSASQLEVLVT